jgi:hypothetical protein
MYNYALTEQQVVNHWKFTWLPAAIDEQPVEASGIEGHSITLTAKASGYPNTRQWFKNGTALAAADNPDGTPHFPQGVTSPTLVISQVTPTDAGQYHLVIANPLGNQTTAGVRVSVSNDTTPPTMTSVSALPTPKAAGGKPYLVKVIFSKRMQTARPIASRCGLARFQPVLSQRACDQRLAHQLRYQHLHRWRSRRRRRLRRPGLQPRRQLVRVDHAQGIRSLHVLHRQR